MTDVPEELMQQGRPDDPHFADDEDLYRRLKPDDIEGVCVAIEAIELPDMSVNRQKYSAPHHLLLDEEFESWAVFAFKVCDIPLDFIEKGTTQYSFCPVHRPLRRNYAHSEVWGYRDGQHIDVKNSDELLDPDAHQRWRQRLVWKCRIVIHPPMLNEPEFPENR